MWGFPKIRGTFLGVPIIWIIVFLGLYWVPPILGNYHVGDRVGYIGIMEKNMETTIKGSGFRVQGLGVI